MEITAISLTTDPVLLTQFGAYDKVMDWVDGAARLCEIYMTSASSMATNVLAKAGGNRISRLNVIAHGSPALVLFGNDLIGMQNFRRFETSFLRLRHRFTENGFVHFQICEIGQNFGLLKFFAKAFGVPVVAGAGSENTLFRFNWGTYTKCYPTGLCTPNISRP